MIGTTGTCEKRSRDAGAHKGLPAVCVKEPRKACENNRKSEAWRRRAPHSPPFDIAGVR